MARNSGAPKPPLQTTTLPCLLSSLSSSAMGYLQACLPVFLYSYYISPCGWCHAISKSTPPSFGVIILIWFILQRFLECVPLIYLVAQAKTWDIILGHHLSLRHFPSVMTCSSHTTLNRPDALPATLLLVCLLHLQKVEMIMMHSGHLKPLHTISLTSKHLFLRLLCSLLGFGTTNPQGHTLLFTLFFLPEVL